MELKEILSITNKYKTVLIAAFLIGAITGVGVFYLPEKYTTTGSFYVTRTAQETSEEYFTYEGYYSQQTAASYTNTVVALLESVDVRKMTLESLNLPITEQNLRKLGRDIQVTKAGPQLVTFTVKRNSPESAQQHWDAMAYNLMVTIESRNQSGDKNLQVLKVSEHPVTKPVYKSLPLDIIVGSIGMLSLAFGYASLKEYAPKERKKIWS